MKRPRALLADHHPIVIEGLRHVLESEFEIAGEVNDGRALVAAVETLQPDVIIAEISMPLLNGIEAVRQIRKMNRKVKITFLTVHADIDFAAEALRAGCSAYILKSSSVAEIQEAMREALKGRSYVTPSIKKALVQAQTAAQGRPDKFRFKLTTRQREVLQLIAEGQSSKEIAEVLHLSPRTIEFHRYRIMKELGLRTTAELIQFAIKNGVAPDVNPMGP